MVYEPEKLKEKKQEHEKKSKMWGKLSILIIMVFEVIYALIYFKLIKEPSLMEMIVFFGGVVLIFLVCEFVLLTIDKHVGARFVSEMNTIVKDYQVHKDGKRFLDELLGMENTPTSMHAEMIWYINVSTALIIQGRKEEGVDLLHKLEEFATDTEAEVIQKQWEWMENNANGEKETKMQ